MAKRAFSFRDLLVLESFSFRELLILESYFVMSFFAMKSIYKENKGHYCILHKLLECAVEFLF